MKTIIPPKTAINYKGEQEKVSYPVRIKPLAKVGAVILFKQGKLFAVSYGLEVTERMTYDDAAKCFGASVLHQSQCEGLLDD